MDNFWNLEIMEENSLIFCILSPALYPYFFLLLSSLLSPTSVLIRPLPFKPVPVIFCSSLLGVGPFLFAILLLGPTPFLISSSPFGPYPPSYMLLPFYRTMCIPSARFTIIPRQYRTRGGRQRVKYRPLI